jgi:hypothetical protein
MNENVLDGRHVQAGDFAARDFMSGGGEMGALMRAHDWSSSSIGPLVSIASDGRAADA